MSDKLKDLARELGISVEDLEKAAERAAKRGDEIEKAKPASVERAPEKEERWNDQEAAERWLEEEADLIDGVHGWGGQTAGGIFGDAPIATSVYDPSCVQRAETRAVGRASIKMIEMMADVQKELAESRAETRRLREAEERRLLTEGRRGRRR